MNMTEDQNWMVVTLESSGETALNTEMMGCALVA